MEERTRVRTGSTSPSGGDASRFTGNTVCERSPRAIGAAGGGPLGVRPRTTPRPRAFGRQFHRKPGVRPDQSVSVPSGRRTSRRRSVRVPSPRGRRLRVGAISPRRDGVSAETRCPPLTCPPPRPLLPPHARLSVARPTLVFAPPRFSCARPRSVRPPRPAPVSRLSPSESPTPPPYRQFNYRANGMRKQWLPRQ